MQRYRQLPPDAQTSLKAESHAFFSLLSHRGSVDLRLHVALPCRCPIISLLVPCSHSVPFREATWCISPSSVPTSAFHCLTITLLIVRGSC